MASGLEGPVNAGGLPYGHDPVSRNSLSDLVINISGVQTLEPGTTQWSSPDALDPSSTSSYVWDNNNPYLYSDPSGYAPCTLGDTTGATNAGGGGGCGGPDPTDIQNSNVSPQGYALGFGTQPTLSQLDPKVVVDPAIDIFSKIVETLSRMGPTGARILENIGRVIARRTVGPGPYAGESIPARSASRSFNDAETAAINRIGGSTGCHTCGSKVSGTRLGNFVRDHQPPNAILENGNDQRLYPQCITCSRAQGSAMSSMIQRGYF